MPSRDGQYLRSIMWYALNKLVYMTIMCLGNRACFVFFSALPLSFLIFVFFSRSVGYITLYKLNCQKLKILIPRSSFDVLFI